jgi:hypothetical protein
MNRTMSLAAALLLASGTAVNAQSLSTGYGGATISTGTYAGNFFNLIALNPGGITINSWDIHVGGSSSLTVQVWYKQGPWEGFQTDPSAWTLAGEVPASAAGNNNPTPVSGAGFHIPGGETYGVRIGVTPGSLRYDATLVATNPFTVDDNLAIESGAAQGGIFTANATANRYWNGTIYYTAHGTTPTGRCCLPSGACELRTHLVCTAAGGDYGGDGSDCGGFNCPQPPTGACCLPGGSCVTVYEGGCIRQGGLYQGDNAACASITCPLELTTTFEANSNASNANAGVFFDLTGHNPAGIVVEGFLVNTHAWAGRPVTMNAYYKSGSYAGFEQDISAWTLLGEVQSIAAGLGEPTPVHVGGLTIGMGDVYGIRVGAPDGGLRYNNTAPIPTYSNNDLQLDMGRVQNSNWGSVLSGIRGWSGTVLYSVAGDPPCYANCDTSTTPPILNVEDFICFINEFAQGQALPPATQITHYANCDNSTTEPVLNVEDFICFVNAFALGCP